MSERRSGGLGDHVDVDWDNYDVDGLDRRSGTVVEAHEDEDEVTLTLQLDAM